MELLEIQRAVIAGKVVHCINERAQVVFRHGRFRIIDCEMDDPLDAHSGVALTEDQLTTVRPASDFYLAQPV